MDSPEPPSGCHSWEVVSEDGSVWLLLAGRTADDSDHLSRKVGKKSEPWLCAADVPGAHFVVRAVAIGDATPRDVLGLAAQFAAFHSEANASSKVKVHLTTCGRVSKEPGASAGQVRLAGSVKTLLAVPSNPSLCEAKEDISVAERDLQTKGLSLYQLVSEAKERDPETQIPSLYQKHRRQRMRQEARQEAEIQKRERLNKAVKELEKEIALVDDLMASPAGANSDDAVKLQKRRDQLEMDLEKLSDELLPLLIKSTSRQHVQY